MKRNKVLRINCLEDGKSLAKSAESAKLNFFATFASKKHVLIFLLLFLSPFLTYSRNLDKDIRKQKRELTRLKKSLADQRGAIKKLVKKKTGVLSKMEKLSQNIGLIKDYLTKLDMTSHTLKLSEEHKKRELEDLQTQIEQRNHLIARRVRWLFMYGKNHNILLGQLPKDEMSMPKRLFFIKRLINYDKSIVSAAQEDAQNQQLLIYSIQQRIEEIKSFKEHKSQEKRVFSKEHKTLRSNLKRLQNDENAKRQALKEMVKNERALLKIIKALEKQRRQEMAGSKKARELDRKGKFCSPVPGGRLVSRYGLQYHKTLRTTTRNLGVEYLGEPGAAVLSAASGKVLYVDDIPGYGKGIIVYNGSGYYNIYGNLHSIKVRVGDKIEGCREIAEIPFSEEKLKRRIYFEVRKERAPVNPVKWLKTMID
jgi:septal ring factor EnvC (AmiA/AmiB activator)